MFNKVLAALTLAVAVSDAANADPRACTSGPIGKFSGDASTGIRFIDTNGQPVNAHGGGIIQVGDTFYLHGQYCPSTSNDGNFAGFTMYSSKDMSTWKNEGVILPKQANGELGPNRKGERPHIIKCPGTGEFVLFAHAASWDYKEKEVVYATSKTVNGQYSYKGALKNANGEKASHNDMGAFSDGQTGYVVTEEGHVYTLSNDCHSWINHTVQPPTNYDSGGGEAPTIFKNGDLYYWIASYKTGWVCNNNFYATSKSMNGPWTHQGFIAPTKNNERTWRSQTTWVQPVQGCQGTTFVFWGDHWNGNDNYGTAGQHNDQATYVFQPLVVNGTSVYMSKYHANWKLDVGKGTWSE